MRRAQSNSPRLPTKNQYHEEARLSHLLLLPDHTSNHLPARPPSYPAATPSHIQREKAEVQLRQLGINANIPRIRVSCEPDLNQINQLLPGQGQEKRGRSPGRSGAWDSEVERQMPKTSRDWGKSCRLFLHDFWEQTSGTFSKLQSDLFGFLDEIFGKTSFPSLVPNSIKLGFGGILVTCLFSPAWSCMNSHLLLLFHCY